MNLKDIKKKLRDDPHWNDERAEPKHRYWLNTVKRTPASRQTEQLLVAWAQIATNQRLLEDRARKLVDTEYQLIAKTHQLDQVNRTLADAVRRQAQLESDLAAARHELATIKQQVAAILAPPPPTRAPQDNPWRVAQIYSSPAYALSSERVSKIQTEAQKTQKP